MSERFDKRKELLERIDRKIVELKRFPKASTIAELTVLLEQFSANEGIIKMQQEAENRKKRIELNANDQVS